MMQVFADMEQLSQAAVALIADRAYQAVEERGRFCMALSGGSTPRRTYQRLARSPYREQLPWQQVHVFWGDERCVAEDDPRSNLRLAREALLDHVSVPSGQIHPMACAADPEAAAAAYQGLLQEFFAPGKPHFDLILLGLGQDGHTASLLPGTPAPQETVRMVIPVQTGREDFARLTLTVPVINQARLVVFLVSGRDKAGILRQVLDGTGQSGFPAQRIVPEQGEVIWLADRDAANLEA